jgi:hypothetical protein
MSGEDIEFSKKLESEHSPTDSSRVATATKRLNKELEAAVDFITQEDPFELVDCWRGKPKKDSLVPTAPRRSNRIKNYSQPFLPPNAIVGPGQPFLPPNAFVVPGQPSLPPNAVVVPGQPFVANRTYYDHYFSKDLLLVTPEGHVVS